MECRSLLLEKEPEEIAMRDIAGKCGVSATTIYYYYADKDALFEAVKLDLLAAMDARIRAGVLEARDSKDKLRTGLVAFRDWALENPKVALLVMGRLKPNVTASKDELARYYRSNDLAKELLDAAVADGGSNVADTKLASALCIAALWGAIEAVLLNRTHPDYWKKEKYFTDRMIDMLVAQMTGSGGNA
jgi:AcrR family transcriptional regulator